MKTTTIYFDDISIEQNARYEIMDEYDQPVGTREGGEHVNGQRKVEVRLPDKGSVYLLISVGNRVVEFLGIHRSPELYAFTGNNTRAEMVRLRKLELETIAERTASK